MGFVKNRQSVECIIAEALTSPLLSSPPPQFKVLMEHLDPDEEEEEGEASANARNKAINALLGGSSPKHHPAARVDDSEDEDSEGDEKTPGVRTRDQTVKPLCLS